MEKFSLRYNFDSIVATVFFASFMLPYLKYWGRGDTVSFCIYAVWLAAIALKKGFIVKVFNVLRLRRLELCLLFIFFLISYFTFLFRSPNPKAFQFVLMPIIYICIVVMDAYYFIRNPEFRYSILFGIVTIMGINAAISIPYIYSAEDMVARMFTMGELEGAALEEAVKHGVGTPVLYTGVIGLIFLGISTFSYHKSKIVKFILTASVLCITFSLFLSSFTNSYAMLILGCLIYLLRMSWKKVKPAYVLLFLIFISVLPFLYTAYLADSQLMEPVEGKIEMAKTGKLKEDGRMDLADVSVNSFVNNPFFGIGVPPWSSYHLVGEHLPWIDFLAHYGIFGFWPIVLFLAVLFKRNMHFYFKNRSSYAIACLTGFVIFIVANFVNPFLFEPPFIHMLLLFYGSMSNWNIKKEPMTLRHA